MRLALLVALGTLAATVLAAGPVSAHRGPIPQYTYGEDCRGGFTDPIGILFYGRDASATRAQQLSDDLYDGMKSGDDDSQHFVTHGECMSTQKSVDDGCFTCNRTHMRIGGLRRPSGRYHRGRGGRIYSVGTPHTDTVTFDCGITPEHVNPVNGFRDARRRWVQVFRAAGYTVAHQRLKNTRRRQQCDGSYAQGDGLVAKIRTTK